MFRIRVWDATNQTWIMPDDWLKEEDSNIDFVQLNGDYGFYSEQSMGEKLGLGQAECYPCLGFPKLDHKDKPVIYNGDIINYKIKDTLHIPKVVYWSPYHRGQRILALYKYGYHESLRNYKIIHNNIEVIGNVMENPELIPKEILNEFKPNPQYGLTKTCGHMVNY